MRADEQERDDTAAVPGGGRQGGEAAGPALRQWSWVEPAVWTERMLQALTEGVKGGVWFSLMDKIYALRNLRASYEHVRANGGSAGVDHVSIEEFGKNLDGNLERLHDELRTGRYRPQPIRRVNIPKPGSRETRPLGIPTVRDRVVQTAVVNVLEPIFERDFAEHSYGFRPGRSCKDALRLVNAALLDGKQWVVDADIRKFFDTIPHAALLARVRQKVADGKVLGLLELFLKARVMDGVSWEPEQGTPQGGVVSPLLANIYLDALDHMMAGAGFTMVRYADDFVVLCRTEAQARDALERVARWTEQAGLTLHPDKTRLVDLPNSDGFDFLGYHFRVNPRNPKKIQRWACKKSCGKFKDRVRAITPRANGQGLPMLIARLNSLLRGFFAYFKHSLWTTFDDLDKWVRMRLRSILRKRLGLKGRGRGADHQRWNNAYFQRQGLFSMLEARASILRSSRR